MRLTRSWRLRRGTWLGAGAVVLAFPAMFISRRFVRFLFDYHNDAMLMLQWVPWRRRAPRLARLTAHLGAGATTLHERSPFAATFA